MAKKKKPARVSTAPEPASTGLGGFGALLAGAGLSASAPTEAAPEPAAAAPGALRIPAKVAVQTSRKGRGGRTVTLVRSLPPEDLDAWAKAARKALGCGASVDGDAVVLQGDLRDRAAAWFTAQGVRKVSR